MRLIIPFGIAIIYSGRVIYLLFKKQLKNHLDEVYTGLFFFAVWALIYWFVFR